TNQTEKFRRVASLSDDAVAGLREQAGDSFTEQEVVVSDDDGPPDRIHRLLVHPSSMRNLSAATHIRLELAQRAISSASSGGQPFWTSRATSCQSTQFATTSAITTERPSFA